MRVRTRAILLAAAAFFPIAAGAQGVIVQSSSEVKFFGAFGKMVGLMARLGGGDMHEIPSTTTVAGHKLRVENEDGATIIDVDGGRFTTVDHKRKTYTSMTFAEMAAAMERAAQQMKQGADKQAAQQAKDPNAPKGEVNLKYSVAVDRPGQHEKIAGYDAERVFLTVTMEAEAKPEGEKAEQVGSLIFLFDQWMSKDAPQIAAVQDFQKAYAAKMGQTFRPPMEALKSAFAANPQIKAGFEASAKELQKVQGIALRSVAYVAGVPAGMTFDRQLVLNDASVQATADAAKKDEKPKGGFRGLLGAIKTAAEDANKQGDKNAQQPPKQGTLLSVTDQVKTISTGAVPPGAFDVPAGYREVKPTAP